MRESRGERLETIRHRPDLVAGVLSTALGTLASGGVLSVAREHQWAASDVAFGAGLGVFAWFAWNIVVRSRISVWQEGVDVVNGFVHHWLPWPSIAVEDSEEVLRLRDGTRVRPLSLLGSPAGRIILSGRHQRGAVQLVEAARLRPSDGEDAQHIRRVEFRWVSLLVIAAIVVGLGLLAPVG